MVDKKYSELFLGKEAAKCMLCYKASCTAACPKNLAPDKFIRSVRFDNKSTAFKCLNKETCENCDAPCEKACSYYDEPIRIKEMALLDERYMKNLSQKTTVNTAIDALTHLIESYLSVKANAVTKALSLEGIRMIASEFENLAEFSLDDEARRKLLIASTFGGMVIAQTGTTAVHSMGYSLTYFKNIDHGRANGLLIAEFLKFVQDKMSSDVDEILKALNMEDLDKFSAVIDGLLKEKEEISEDELKDFSQIAIKAKNIMNCSVVLNADDLLKIYRSSFKK